MPVPEYSRDPAAPIGIFDSGLGGLSILREIEKQLPDENLVYFGDTLHLPYGPRQLEQVRRFCFAIAENLIRYPVKLIVVACNTASAAALHRLRQSYPDFDFVGMEPAVKPAAAQSRTGKVGVLATTATFQGELFESVVKRYASRTEVICQACPGLAEFIEHSPPDHPDLLPMLRNFIQPLVERGVDTLVLGCTHYPLIHDRIADVAGAGVVVVDPSPAIARRARSVLEQRGLLNQSGRAGAARIFCSGDATQFSAAASRLLGREIRSEQLPWSEKVEEKSATA